MKNPDKYFESLFKMFKHDKLIDCNAIPEAYSLESFNKNNDKDINLVPRGHKCYLTRQP